MLGMIGNSSLKLDYKSQPSALKIKIINILSPCNQIECLWTALKMCRIRNIICQNKDRNCSIECLVLDAVLLHLWGKHKNKRHSIHCYYRLIPEKQKTNRHKLIEPKPKCIFRIGSCLREAIVIAKHRHALPTCVPMQESQYGAICIVDKLI